MHKLKQFFAQYQIQLLLVIYQFISVYLMATGVWPVWVAWINVGFIAVYIVFANIFSALLLTILSIPFYVALPNQYVDGFAMWRVVVLLLGVKLLVLEFSGYWLGVRKSWTKLLSLIAPFAWERYLGLFILFALLSLLVARYPVVGLKQIVFLLNVYVLYVVAAAAVRTQQQIVTVIKATAISLAIIVALGYVQFIATFFTEIYYFWQYWAVQVSGLYYGLDLANVLVYSNSWFSELGGQRSLRMFSIMPDSHSFAMVAVFLSVYMLPFIWSMSLQTKTRPLSGGGSKARAVVRRVLNYRLWSIVRFSSLAIILSGTRGVWVGMLPALSVAFTLYLKNILRPYMSKILMSMLLVVLLFPLSPIINAGLNYIRLAGYRENFLDRAASIYDLTESSNAGRLIIWKDSALYALSHPLGTGYGNFIVSLFDRIPPGATYEQLAQTHNERYNLPQKFITAHSLYLHMLVELGLIGLAAFVAFWLKYYKEIWRFLKRTGQQYSEYGLFVAATAVMFLWFLAYSMFDLTIFNDKVMLYGMVSLALSGAILHMPTNDQKVR